MELFWQCDTIIDGTELSQCFRTHVIGTLIPSSVFVLFLATYLFTYLKSRFKPLQRIWSRILSPFSQFLELTDLAEYDPTVPRNRYPRWKRQTLQYLAGLQFLLWTSNLIHELETDGGLVDAALAGAHVGAWGTITFILFKYPPRTAPYLLLLFFIAHVCSAAIDVVSGISSKSTYQNAAILQDTLRLVVTSILTWITGSLPMRYVLPCPNVATIHDIPSNSQSSPEDRVTLWQWLSFSFVESILDLAVDRSRPSSKPKTKTNIAITPYNIDDDRNYLLPDELSDTASDIIPQSIGASSTLAAAPMEIGHHALPILMENGTENGSTTVGNGLTHIDDDDDDEIERPGEKKTLNAEDVWSLPPTFLHRNLFKKYLSEQNKLPEQSLIWFLVKSNSVDLIIGVVMEMWKATAGFIPSYCLQQILALLSLNTPEAHSKAYLFAFLTFVIHLSQAQVDLFQGWHSRRCYERTRGQLFCAIHWKALKRRDVSNIPTEDGKESASADLGKVVNLMQGDTYAVAQRFWEFSGVLAAPVRLTIALVFLYQVLGWSSLSGVLVVVVAWGLNYPLAKWNIWVC
ncbi:hypothetical protein M422DRAFT_265448 [Sphaerobolus stellatus SS14]|uniref:ABC transmembrane type-1 domain-containing protein n=1 Tax=Sphaerobolus stellatus (strain SS14) TaxID=990650 RepID=A0A0C9V5K0_SPHS4|nr:hypothetical protein M422DRAFT_265448 [Sphaerobolus stellatus SS14]